MAENTLDQRVEETAFMSKIVTTAIKYSAGHVRDVSLHMGGRTFVNNDRDLSRFAETVGKKTKTFSELAAINYINQTQILNTALSTTVEKICGIIKNLPTQSMNRQQLNAVNDYMSGFAHLLQTISSAHLDGKFESNNPVSMTILNNYANDIKLYASSIESFAAAHKEVDELSADKSLWGAEGYSKAIYNLSMTAIQEEDLALVEAFKFIGSPLVRDADTGKWSLDRVASENSPNGIDFVDKDGKTSKYHLPDANVQAFIDGYLNKSPLERGNKVITPQGLFRFYVDSLGNSPKHANNYEKSVVDKFVQEASLQFDAGSRAWKTTLITNEEMIRRDATRLALADVYHGLLPEAEPIESVYSEELTEQINNNKSTHVVKPLDRLSDSIIDSQGEIVDGISSDKKELEASIESITARYKESYDQALALYNTAKANNSPDLNVYEERMNNVANAMATLIAIREIQSVAISKAIEGIDKSAEKVERVEEIAKIFATTNCIQVAQTDKGEWSITFDNTKLSKYVSFTIEEEFGKSLKTKINSSLGIETQATQTSVESSSNSSGTKTASAETSEEIIKVDDTLTNEDLYNLFFDGLIDEHSEFEQALEDEAIYYRTQAIFGKDSPDNSLKKAFDNYFQFANATASGFISDLKPKLSIGSDESIDNFLFGEESLSRLKDPQLQADKNAEYLNYLVLMDRMGARINSSQASLNLINGMSGEQVNGEFTPEVKALLSALYKEEKKNLETKKPTQEEIDRAKAKFQNLNLHRSFEKLQNFEGQDLIGTTLSKDPAIQKILADKQSEVEKTHIAQKEQEERERTAAREQQQQEAAEAEADKKNKPYKFGDKYNKKDGSAILKKLKPYCAKSSIKIIDDIIKMIDNTIIVPKPKEETIKRDGNGIGDGQGIVSGTPEQTVGDVTHDKQGTSGPGGKPGTKSPGVVDNKTATPVTPDNKTSANAGIDSRLAQLQAELERKGQYAYLASGEIIDKWLALKEGQNIDPLKNKTDMEGIRDLFRYIGNQDISNPENMQTRLEVLNLIEEIMSGGKDSQKPRAQREALLLIKIEGLESSLEKDSTLDKTIKENIIKTLQTGKSSFILQALTFSSRLNGNKLQIGEQVGAEVIQSIKKNGGNLEDILKDAGFFSEEKFNAVDNLYNLLETNKVNLINLLNSDKIPDGIEKVDAIRMSQMAESYMFKSKLSKLMQELIADKSEAETYTDQIIDARNNAIEKKVADANDLDKIIYYTLDKFQPGTPGIEIVETVKNALSQFINSNETDNKNITEEVKEESEEVSSQTKYEGKDKALYDKMLKLIGDQSETENYTDQIIDARNDIIEQKVANANDLDNLINDTLDKLKQGTPGVEIFEVVWNNMLQFINSKEEEIEDDLEEIEEVDETVTVEQYQGRDAELFGKIQKLLKYKNEAKACLDSIMITMKGWASAHDVSEDEIYKFINDSLDKMQPVMLKKDVEDNVINAFSQYLDEINNEKAEKDGVEPIKYADSNMQKIFDRVKEILGDEKEAKKCTDAIGEYVGYFHEIENLDESDLYNSIDSILESNKSAQNRDDLLTFVSNGLGLLAEQRKESENQIDSKPEMMFENAHKESIFNKLKNIFNDNKELANECLKHLDSLWENFYRDDKQVEMTEQDFFSSISSRLGAIPKGTNIEAVKREITDAINGMRATRDSQQSQAKKKEVEKEPQSNTEQSEIEPIPVNEWGKQIYNMVTASYSKNNANFRPEMVEKEVLDFLKLLNEIKAYGATEHDIGSALAKIKQQTGACDLFYIKQTMEYEHGIPVLTLDRENEGM